MGRRAGLARRTWAGGWRRRQGSGSPASTAGAGTVAPPCCWRASFAGVGPPGARACSGSLAAAHRPPAAASTPCSVMLLSRAATETAAEARGRHQQNILCECPLVGTARFGRPDRALGSEASAG